VLAIDLLQKILDLETETGLLSKIRGRWPYLRLSLYTDDAALFIAPKIEEVETILKLLGLFGEVSGLLTNFHEPTMVPIRCQGIDLNAVLRNLPARRATFPLKYLGLPLSSFRLKKSDF
jgi:hypothetical protein